MLPSAGPRGLCSTCRDARDRGAGSRRWDNWLDCRVIRVADRFHLPVQAHSEVTDRKPSEWQLGTSMGALGMAVPAP